MNVQRRRLLRSSAVAAAVTTLLWGRFLLPGRTLSPDAQLPTLLGDCRVAGSDLTCVQRLGPIQSADSAAPAWTEIPASYYFRAARESGWGHPSWSPFIGSGYPIALDGHNAVTSPTRWFLSHMLGDEGRDILIVGRFFFWTFGIALSLTLLDVGWVALIVGAVAAGTAQYATARVDHVMLDVDLLAPWFPALLLAYAGNMLPLRAAAILAFGLGALVSCLGFPEAQATFCFVVAVCALAALPVTRFRSLWLGLATACGFALLAPTWIGLLRHLGEFASSRDVFCFALRGLGPGELWTQLMDARLGHTATLAGTVAGVLMIPFAPRTARWLIAALAVLYVWLIVGLPGAACGLPLVAGIRFNRHLQPHVQALLLVTVIAGADSLARHARYRRKWLLAAVPVAAGALALLRRSGAMTRFFELAAINVADLQGSAVATIIVIAIACTAAWVAARRYGHVDPDPPAGLRILSLGVLLIAGVAVAMNARIVLANLPGAASVPALPRTFSTSSALGAARALSINEDRRHYSPAGYVYPNWGQAIGLMEMLSVQALYPRASHELNSSLFHDWGVWPENGIRPDRFVTVPLPLAMSPEFQRVLAVNRVSLFTFKVDEPFFAESGSPYERSRCRLLVRAPAQKAESWVCPSIGGVGFFPSALRVVADRPAALSQMAELPAAFLANAAMLGPEIDLRIGEETVPEPLAGEGQVLQVDRRGDDLTYVLDVRRPGIFVIADTYFPGWTASVNGRPAGISRANVAFKAVRVPAGRVALRLHFALR